jgi:hypothetical protein
MAYQGSGAHSPNYEGHQDAPGAQVRAPPTVNPFHVEWLFSPPDPFRSLLL